MSRLEIWKHWQPGQPLYVTRGSTARELADDEDGDVWTISPSEEVIGWETDSGCGGYGLPKRVADAIVEIYKEGVASGDLREVAVKALAALEAELDENGGTLGERMDLEIQKLRVS